MLKLTGQHGSYLLEKQVNKGGFSKIYKAQVKDYRDTPDKIVGIKKGDEIIVRIVEACSADETKVVQKFIDSTRQGKSKLQIFDQFSCYIQPM